MFILIIMIQSNVYLYPAKTFKSLHLRQNYEETFPHSVEKKIFNTKEILKELPVTYPDRSNSHSAI